MLYMLVVCGGAICMPVDGAATYTLTWPECEARAMQMRVASRSVDVDCFSDASWGYGDEKWVLRETEHGMVIAHPH